MTETQAELDEFRAEVAEWCRKHVPAGWRSEQTGVPEDQNGQRKWAAIRTAIAGFDQRLIARDVSVSLRRGRIGATEGRGSAGPCCFKLRVRFYDDNPQHPVFFEVKRRVNDAIVKVRAKVRRDAADRLMYAHHAWPDRPDLANPADDRGYAALCKFCDLRDKMEARPQVMVGYSREAWCAREMERATTSGRRAATVRGRRSGSREPSARASAPSR